MMFDNIEIEKLKFHQCKNLILLKDLDNDNKEVSSIVSGKKNINILLVTKMAMIIKLKHYT